MTYQEATDKIDSRLLFGIKAGLRNITALMHELGDPQDTLQFVHVAGTNGKGTTCTLTASVLRESGYKVGLYISPYVLEFRERFQINGEMIPKEELAEEVGRIWPIIEKMDARDEYVTEFELITALAFDWFARKKCDIVVLEVGLGGITDATNIIKTPAAAAIASISFDHTAILGDTLEKIAGEKAGIIKPGGQVALYPEQEPEVTEQIKAVCREKGAGLFIPDMGKIQVEGAGISGTDFTVEGLRGTQGAPLRLHTPFLGAHQVKNAATVLEIIRILRAQGFSIPDEALAEGFRKAFIPARMEVISQAPLCLLDGGHNPGCARALRGALEEFVPQRKIGIMGIMADKDSQRYLEAVGPLLDKMVTVTPNWGRALPAGELAEKARAFCPRVYAAETCGEAIAAAMKDMTKDDALIVCGSFYLASEIRGPLKGKLENLQY